MKNMAFIFLIVILAGTCPQLTESSEKEKIGYTVFEQRGCGACHDRTKDQTIHRLGPSLEQIAEAYEGREEDLETFLKGGCGPIVDEARYEIMHGEIVKLKGLSDAQIRDLRLYICGEE